MAAIVYSCPFVPPEWIAAHGFKPCRIVPQGAEIGAFAFPRTGVCPYAAAYAVAAAREPDAAAIVVTTTCDQMRRIAERLAALAACPVFVFHVPTAADSPAAPRLYRDEVVRFGRLLERLGGTRPGPEQLADTMQRFDAGRNALRAMRSHVRPRQFTEAIMRFQQGDWTVLSETRRGVAASPGVPLALAGGPLMQTDLELFDAIQRAGGAVVLDATATGERTLPRSFDRRALLDDPLEELADAYFGSIPDAFRRPNAGLYEWLKGVFEDRGVRGVVLRHYVWCDMWQAETLRLRERGGVPVLALDVAEEDPSLLGRAAGRIRAFVEALR